MPLRSAERCAGLLREVPRTATVTTTTHCTLLTLDKESFLTAVTGNAAVHESVTGIAGARLAGASAGA